MTVLFWKVRQQNNCMGCGAHCLYTNLNRFVRGIGIDFWTQVASAVEFIYKDQKCKSRFSSSSKTDEIMSGEFVKDWL